MSTNVRYFVKGKDAELFPNLNIAPTVQSYLGLNYIPEKTIELFKLTTAGTQAFWELNGANCLMVMAPDKTTVYPELLPSPLLKLDKRSKSEQIDAAFRDTPVNFLNLREVLEKQKPTLKLFNKRFDIVHWNGHGLAVAYQEIFNALYKMMPELEPKLKETLYTIVPKEVENKGFGRETVPWMKLLYTENLEVVPNDFITLRRMMPWAKPDLVHNKKADRGRLLLLTDSYMKSTHMHKLHGAGGAISPLAHHFQTYLHMHYSHMNLHRMNQILKEFKPDSVVYLFAERATPRAPAFINRNAHYLLFLGDIYLKNTSIILNSAKKTTESIIGSSHPIERDKNNLEMIARHNAPQIHLSPVRADARGRVVVLAKIMSPTHTFAQLFFAQGEDTFSQTRSVKQKIKQGVNYLHLPVYGRPGETMRLRLDPGAAPGKYVILPILETSKLEGSR